MRLSLSFCVSVHLCVLPSAVRLATPRCFRSYELLRYRASARACVVGKLLQKRVKPQVNPQVKLEGKFEATQRPVWTKRGCAVAAEAVDVKQFSSLLKLSKRALFFCAFPKTKSQTHSSLVVVELSYQRKENEWIQSLVSLGEVMYCLRPTATSHARFSCSSEMKTRFSKLTTQWQWQQWGRTVTVYSSVNAFEATWHY